jgi:hypothetical protein
VTRSRGALVVGWRERVDLPEWGIGRLAAKLDTGARTSSLHVVDLHAVPGGRVSFQVVLNRHRPDRWVRVEAPLVRTTRVRSSTGVLTLRHVVRTRLRLGPIDREIEINLVDRGPMIHRMLIGRSGLAGVLVAPDRRDLVSSPRATTRRGDSP